MKLFSSLYIVLASMSRYRAECLKKTPIRFQAIAPHIDETPFENEDPHAMVLRLARKKAEKIHTTLDQIKFQPTHILASDQTLVCQNQILGKPKTFEKAQQHLALMSDETLRFITSLVLINCETGITHEAVDVTQVQMKKLSQETIDKYLNFEKPFDCAGSFKSEASGALLCKHIQGRDPNALIGLPLMLLMDFLEEEGYSPFY